MSLRGLLGSLTGRVVSTLKGIPDHARREFVRLRQTFAPFAGSKGTGVGRSTQLPVSSSQPGSGTLQGIEHSNFWKKWYAHYQTSEERQTYLSHTENFFNRKEE